MTIIWLIVFAALCIVVGIANARSGGPGWLSLIFYLAAGALGLVIIFLGIEMIAGPFPGLRRYS